MVLTKTPILPNCQVQNVFFWYKGTSINDVRQFVTIFDPPSPLTSDFYRLMSDFWGSFQTLNPPLLKSDIINGRSLTVIFFVITVTFIIQEKNE